MKTLVVLPDRLAAELKHTIPSRQRSHFIADAVEKKLKALKSQKFLARIAGSWTETDHPDLLTQEGINRHIGRIRGWK